MRRTSKVRRTIYYLGSPKIDQEVKPIEVAKFAITNKYADEPAFKWWVSKVLKGQTRLSGRVKSRCRKGLTSKFGIDILKTVKDAIRIDKENGNKLW